jgi:hypothetical protein
MGPNGSEGSVHEVSGCSQPLLTQTNQQDVTHGLVTWPSSPTCQLGEEKWVDVAIHDSSRTALGQSGLAQHHRSHGQVDACRQRRGAEAEVDVALLGELADQLQVALRKMAVVLRDASKEAR